MHRLAIVMLLTAAASCANQAAAEREESDRLSSNNRSMPSAGDQNPRPASDDEVEPKPAPASKRASSSSNAATAAAVAAAAQEAAKKMQEAKESSDKQCAPLENRPVPTVEEEDIGMELALSEATSGGSVYVDGVDKAAARKLFETRFATLPPGDKSAVSAYVQKIGQAMAGPKARVTFVVAEDTQPRLMSFLGGWVVVTTGRLAQFGNEAELAAALAHEVAHIGAKDVLAEYAKARFSACTISITGANLVAAGAGDIPGGPAAVQGSAFNKSQQLLAADELALAIKAPGVDASFALYLIRSNLAMQRLTRDPALELKADEGMFAMISAAGYDAQAMANVPSAERGGMPPPERTAALAKKQRRGRLPPLPTTLKWPH